GGVAFEKFVIGLRQPMLLGPADGELDPLAADEPLERARHIAAPAGRILRGVRQGCIEDRTAHIAWDHPAAAACREINALADILAAELARDIECRIAEPDDDDTLAIKIERLGRIDVIVAMHR